jgi:class 3 adenylate cyclase/tetratricopeptide (TPR) repeat protein
MDRGDPPTDSADTAAARGPEGHNRTVAHAPRRQTAVDELLDRAVTAVNRGDHDTARRLADQVLAVDSTNTDAGELLAAPTEDGKLRRLTIMFADLVDSTALSTRVEPEVYRTVVGRYRDEVVRNVERYGGHVGNTKGDGLLAVFGHPEAHEDDVRRAAQAGLDITRSVAALSTRVQRSFGFEIDVRVGIHRGLVYLDIAQDDVYGFAANLAARMCSVAAPGTVAVSDAVASLIRDGFELETRPPQRVKGVDAEVIPYRVVAERDAVTVAQEGPIVGRDQEVAALAQRWERVVAGAPQTVGIALHGESGIGKSRVARTVVDLAEQHDALVLELTGSPFHSDVGMHPVRRLLERRCRLRRGSDPDERLARLRAEVAARALDVDTVVPLLAPLLGITPDHGYTVAPAEGHRLQGRIAATVVEYLAACVADGPAVLLVEDMHWFDPASKGVVAAMLRAGLGHLLVVMTSRDTASLPDAENCTVLHLAPLAPEDADCLVRLLYPESSEHERENVLRRCDGVPLYIEEVVAKLAHQSASSATDTEVPDSLYEALFARLRSSERALRFVEAAATVGDRFDLAVVRAVVGLSETEVADVIAELQARQVLQPVADEVWRFRHELLREVAAELPPPSIRRRLHGRIAAALSDEATQGDPDWPLIAQHYQKAGDYDQAAAAHHHASSAARRRGALGEALDHLTVALEQLQHVPPSPDRDHREVALRLRHGFLAAAAEGPRSAQAAADFERCLELSGTDPHADELFATLMALFTYYVNRADLGRADAVVRTLRVGVDGGRHWWRSENLAGSGVVCFLRGQFADAAAYLEEAAATAAARGDHNIESEWFAPFDPMVLDFTSLAQARWMRGDLTGADEALRQALARADQLDFPQGPFSLCYTRYVEATIAIETGQADRALAAAADMSAVGGQQGFDQWITAGALMQQCGAAVAALQSPPVDSAALAQPIDMLTGWVTACRAVETTGFLSSFDALLARLLLAADRRDEARARIEAGLALARSTGMDYYDCEFLRLRAATHPDPDAARADLDAAHSTAVTMGANGFALRAALELHDTCGAAAYDILREALTRMPAEGTWPEVRRARAVVGGADDQSTR